MWEIGTSAVCMSVRWENVEWKLLKDKKTVNGREIEDVREETVN